VQGLALAAALVYARHQRGGFCWKRPKAFLPLAREEPAKNVLRVLLQACGVASEAAACYLGRL
jgi:hypothetical protein